jgi:hypothetical protein
MFQGNDSENFRCDADQNVYCKIIVMIWDWLNVKPSKLDVF